MADITKYAPINGGLLISDFKTHFSTKRIFITLVFICNSFIIFLAFSPSSSSSSPWFTPSEQSQSHRSHISSIYFYFFPILTTSSQAHDDASPMTTTQFRKAEILNSNDSTVSHSVNQIVNNNTNPRGNSSEISKGFPDIDDQKQPDDKNGVLMKNQSTVGVENGSSNNGGVKNVTSSLMKKKKGGIVDDLMNCDMFDGKWVKDSSYPLYKPGSCTLIDEQFNCFANGRPDTRYLKLRWKPKGCNLPRLNGSHMLELLRGKRLVFVGDSLNRNMWESLICILRNSVKDQTKVYEQFGRQQFRTEISYSFFFEDYNFTVEFFVAPFLVREWEVVGKNGKKKETLRLDLISRTADGYKNADFIVFNTGHWWTHEKTSLGKDYYQEGRHVYSELDVLEAFRKAVTTWGRWLDANVDPMKSFVFFRGYSASHFSGGQWNSGGQCDHETRPIKNDTFLAPYPSMLTVLEKVFQKMKTNVTYLNVTRMTDYRKDGHPSVYRKLNMLEEEKRSLSIQDCSHWCLPGVPDSWNEILYAQILVKLHVKQQMERI